ncbi:MAG: HD domain-containing protein [Solirubrobacterales bacterium]|nr:HD domain-containing protein [Solirubrobacterales bacterium]
MTSYDVQHRVRVFRTGVGVTWTVALAAIAYLALTWDAGSNRGWLVALCGLAIADGAVAAVLPHRRIAESGPFDRLIVTWSCWHIAAAVVACMLDGGLSSPFLSVLFCTMAYAAVTLPPRPLVLVGAVDVAALALISALDAHGSRAWSPAVVMSAAGLLVTAGVCAAISDDRGRRIAALRDAKEEVLRRLAVVVEFRDNETGGHVERMSEYCAIIARRLGWCEEATARLRLASTMHDIGKVAVPDHILLKPGPLTPAERAEMERHARTGHDMLAGSGSDLLDLAATIALTHHERHDGAGYPSGLAGEAIPEVGRIAAVADVFDALTSDRVYKSAMDPDAAFTVVRSGRGTQFDPAVVDAFLAARDEVLRVRAAIGADAPGAQLLAA